MSDVFFGVAHLESNSKSNWEVSLVDFLNQYWTENNIKNLNQLSLNSCADHRQIHDFGCNGEFIDSKNIFYFNTDVPACVRIQILELLNDLKIFATDLNHIKFKISLIRLMNLKPKTNLSYHSDNSFFRIHVPIKTNINSFFVVKDTVYRMPLIGEGYVLNSSVLHTAINADKILDRLHLVIDCGVI